MIFVIFVVLTIATSYAEDGQNEITSNAIVERSPSTDKAIESREFIDKTIIRPVPGPPMKLRRSRYLRQAPRPRRRPPFEPRNMRRPGNNFPNLYGPRSRFKPNGPFRPGPPPKSRFRYRDNWRHKWPEYHHQPPMYLDEEEMEQDPPYEEYDDGEEYKDDLWYSPKKYRDMYDDTVPTSSKYNEKRSPSRYLASYDFSRPKVRANYDPFEAIPMKDAAEWQDRNRYSKNYRNILDILTNGKKYDEEEPMEVPMHRFKLNNWNRFKQLEDDEYDFSSNVNSPKSRRMKTEKAAMRRPQVADDLNKYTKGEVTDVSKYFALMQASAAGLSAKEQAGQEAVYSAKYRGRDATDKGDDKSKFKIGEDVSSADVNILHEWKRTQKPNADFQNQFVATEEKSNGVVDAATIARNQNYKDDHLSPSELIAYMSVDPGESVVGKEERYLHTAYPFGEKLSDHDILKATFPRKISPIIDQDLEITFDDRIGDWKH